MSAVPRVALDAHGADTSPAPEIAGALAAVEETGTPVVLVGDRPRLEALIRAQRPAIPAGLSFVHAPDVISMDDEPSRVVRKKMSKWPKKRRPKRRPRRAIRYKVRVLR